MVFRHTKPDRSLGFAKARPVRFFYLIKTALAGFAIRRANKDAGDYKFPQSVLFLFLLMLLSSCNRMSETLPTAMPDDYLPTAVALTAESLASPVSVSSTPTASLAPTITPTFTLTPSPTPTASRTPTPGPLAPLPPIRILSPGPMSKIISPVELKAYVQPGADNRYMIELLGEDGRLLFREVRRHQIYLTEGVYTNIKIPFETRAAAELGRLQITTVDKFGRLREVHSVHLLLLSVGTNDINIGDGEYARASFHYPESGDEISGGTLAVTGEFQPFNNNPVAFELLDEEDKTIGLRVINMEAGVRAPFETTIPYDVDETTSARLIIRQADEKFEGTVFLHSLTIILNP